MTIICLALLAFFVCQLIYTALTARNAERETAEWFSDLRGEAMERQREAERMAQQKQSDMPKAHAPRSPRTFARR
jgi:hypothetical protein